MKWLLLAIIIVPVATMFTMYGDVATDWHIYFGVIIGIGILATLGMFLLVPKKNTCLKILSFLAMGIPLWFAADYVIFSIYEESELQRRINDFIFLLTFIPASFYVAFRSEKPEGVYRDNATFYVKKKPYTFLQFLLSLFYKFGSRSLVINSKEFVFTYKNKYLVERKYKPNPEHSYEEIKPIPMSVARKFLKSKWSVVDSCRPGDFYTKIEKEAWGG